MTIADELPSPTRRRLLAEARRVEAEIARLGRLDADGLRAAAAERRAALRRPGAAARERRGAALAVVARAAEHTLGLRPSTVQLAAALAMQEGLVARLPSGEGKTLAIALAATLAVWSGRRCHVVTASDYLAVSAASAMQPLYAICGCSSGALAAETAPADLPSAYGADVLHATGRQLLSDHLREQLAAGGGAVPGAPVPGSAPRRPTDFTRVVLFDDIEAALLDESMSPMMISVPGDAAPLEEGVRAATRVVETLCAGRDYRLVGEAPCDVRFTADGQRRVADVAAQLPAFWQPPQRSEHILSLAILARDVIRAGEHYVVEQGRLVAADDLVARVVGGRAWQFGVLQAVEVREGLAMTPPPRTLARCGLQQFVPRYAQLCGVGSELGGLRGELRRVYDLAVVALPAGEPSRVVRRGPHGFPDGRAKLAALVDAIGEFHAQALPVLVGVRRAADAVEVAARLGALGLEFRALLGRDPAGDAAFAARAGEPGAITLVIGNAGRGSPIALPPGVAAQGGMRVLLCEHGDTTVADRVLISRAARRGMPAIVESFASPEDELIARRWPTLSLALRRPFVWPRVRNPCVAVLIRLAQWSGRRQASRFRRSLAQREEQLDEQLSFAPNA